MIPSRRATNENESCPSKCRRNDAFGSEINFFSISFLVGHVTRPEESSGGKTGQRKDEGQVNGGRMRYGTDRCLGLCKYSHD